MAMVKMSIKDKNKISNVRFGVAKFDRKLKALETRLQRKVVRQALRAGARVIAAEAKANAPVGKTGALKDSIRVWALKRSRRRIGVKVGSSIHAYKGDQFYGAFLEFGTSKMDPKPWLAPAIEAKKGEATRIVDQTLAAGIEREIKALRGK